MADQQRRTEADTGAMWRRWLILALLFLSTVINYVDRQTLSILARTIQNELGMSELDYASVVQMFLLAYTLAYLVVGRVTDVLGTRASMALFIGWWSLANMATALAIGARSLGACRFLLGLGEAGNYTAAPKAVAEWFSVRQRAFAVGVYTAGAMVGATIAPPLISSLGLRYGWRTAFVVTGAVGLLWIIPWLLLYRNRTAEARIVTPARTGTALWRDALSRRSVWLLIAARMITDPVWYFYLFWFPKYLTDVRGLELGELGRVAWVVYLAADVGSIAGGWMSGWLIGRGKPTVAARLAVMSVAALVVPAGALVAAGVSLNAALALGALVAFAHLTWQVTLSALVVDLYPQHMMATLFGVIAAGSGFGGMLSTQLVGYAVTNFSYAPVFASMAVLHPVAALLVRRVRATADSPIHP